MVERPIAPAAPLTKRHFTFQVSEHLTCHERTGKAPGATVRNNAAGGRLRKMAANDQQRFVRCRLHEARALPGGKSPIHIEIHNPIRDGDLNRAVHDVAGDDCFLPAGGNAYAHMARGVARRRFKPDLLVDTVLHLDQIDQPSLDDGHDALFHVQHVVIALGSVEHHPMLVFYSAEEIASIRERGNPAIVKLLRIPADVIEVQVSAQDDIDIVRV